MKELNEKEQQVLNFVQEYLQDNGYPPSVRDICKKFGFASPRSGQKYLEALEAAGYIEKSNKSRGLKLLSLFGTKEPLMSGLISLPILGRIAAGAPLDLIEQTGEAEMMAVPRNLVGRKPCYVLQVKGDSMIDDHIMSGDFIVIEEAKSAENGQVVVALINNNEATLKRYYREPSRIRLQPANSTMKPIYVKDLAIQGVVRGLFRRF
jgi:repressor LexA